MLNGCKSKIMYLQSKITKDTILNYVILLNNNVNLQQIISWYCLVSPYQTVPGRNHPPRNQEMRHAGNADWEGQLSNKIPGKRTWKIRKMLLNPTKSLNEGQFSIFHLLEHVLLVLALSATQGKTGFLVRNLKISQTNTNKNIWMSKENPNSPNYQY